MSAFISPYALLSASKPRAATRPYAPYDLYSLAQQRPDDIPAAEPSVPEAAYTPAAAPIPPAKRTHYISDINTRHSKAAGRTAFTDGVIP